MSNRIVIVDKTDTPIGLKTYKELRHTDVYRVSALWLTDKKTGDILLQQRKWNKHNDPGKWQCAVAGTVDEGETYEQNIVKETWEEIGLRNIELSEGPKEFVDGETHKFFCQWFLSSVDRETITITIQESELEAVKWTNKNELVTDVMNHPENYPPSTMTGLEVLGVVQKNKESA
jgi:8-oxo-dGTP pyrophosphatase MutT (NUDIX family)